LPLALGGFLRGAAPLLLFLPLLLGGTRESSCGLGFAQQPLAFGRVALFPLMLDGFEPQALFFVRAFSGGLGLAQHPLALGGFLRGAALLLFLQSLELGLTRAVGRGARFVHQPLAFGGVGRLAPPALLFESLALDFARTFRRRARLLHEALALGDFLGFAPQALFFVPLPLGLVRALRGRFRLAQQPLAFGGAFRLEPVLFFLQPDPFLFERALGGRFSFTRGALGGRRLFGFAAPACLLGPAGFRLLGAPLRLFRLLAIARPLLLGFPTQAGLLLLCRATQTRLFLFGRLARRALGRGSRGSDRFLRRIHSGRRLGHREIGRLVHRPVFRPDLRRPGEIRAELLGEHRRIAAVYVLGILLPTETSEEAAAAPLFDREGPRQHRDRVRLDVGHAIMGAQVRDQLVFVARRHERGEQDDVRYACIQRRHGGIPRVDDLDLRVDLRLDEIPQQGGLTRIGFEREDQRHVPSRPSIPSFIFASRIPHPALRLDHEQEEQRARRCEDDERRVLDALVLGGRDDRISEI
jgi:hypothetical protein